MYGDINRWAYFREKGTLGNNFIQKKGGGHIFKGEPISRDDGATLLQSSKRAPMGEYLTSPTKRGVSALPSVFCI